MSTHGINLNSYDSYIPTQSLSLLNNANLDLKRARVKALK